MNAFARLQTGAMLVRRWQLTVFTAARPAERVVATLVRDPEPTESGINDQINALTGLVARADLHAIAGQTARSLVARSEAIRISRQLQATIAAQVSASFEEDEIEGALVAWQDALAAPQAAAPSARLLVNMIEAGRVDDAGFWFQTRASRETAARLVIDHQAIRSATGRLRKKPPGTGSAIGDRR
jgi:hypothetical protein